MIRKIIYLTIVISLLGISVFLGQKAQNSDMEKVIGDNFDNIKSIQKISDNCYYLYNEKKLFGKPTSILIISKGIGYSGSIQVGVNYSTDGKILEAKVLHQTETPVFFKRVSKGKFIEQYFGKSVKENFSLGNNIAAVSGATISCSGINSAIEKANRQACQSYFHEKLHGKKGMRPPDKKEVFLVILLSLTLIVSRSKKITVRRYLPVIRIISLVGLGFVFKGLLSISHFNNLLVGNFPARQYYWYLLLGFFIFTILLTGKNLYFSYICPMGTLQDYLAKLSPKKIKITNRKYYRYPAIFFTLVILCYAAIFNKPGFFGYEIFSAVFMLDFSFYMAVIVVIALFGSLLIPRFWCRFLCPVGVVGRFLMMVRRLFIKKK